MPFPGSVRAARHARRLSRPSARQRPWTELRDICHSASYCLPPRYSVRRPGPPLIRNRRACETPTPL
jgi:hypothetical protein